MILDRCKFCKHQTSRRSPPHLPHCSNAKWKSVYLLRTQVAATTARGRSKFQEKIMRTASKLQWLATALAISLHLLQITLTKNLHMTSLASTIVAVKRATSASSTPAPDHWGDNPTSSPIKGTTNSPSQWTNCSQPTSSPPRRRRVAATAWTPRKSCQSIKDRTSCPSICLTRPPPFCAPSKDCQVLTLIPIRNPSCRISKDRLHLPLIIASVEKESSRITSLCLLLISIWTTRTFSKLAMTVLGLMCLIPLMLALLPANLMLISLTTLRTRIR